MADPHSLAGDESATPAIAASLEALPGDAAAVVRLVCDGPDHEVALDPPAEIREIQRHLLADHRIDRRDLSCSPYWRRDMTDEAWREVERSFVAEMETDVPDEEGPT